MKKILKNKKGFTLVELLAVIVILAIIMVIATQQIGKVIAGARADSFVESYQMIAKQVETNILAGLTDTEIKTSAKYGLSSDYKLTITGDSSTGFNITLEPDYTESNGNKTYSGKFENIDLSAYGKNKCTDITDTADGKINIGTYNNLKCNKKIIYGSSIK